MKIKPVLKLNVLRKLIAYYIIITLSVLVTLIPVYTEVLKSTRKKAVQDYYYSLHQSVASISSEMARARDIMNYLDKEPYFKGIALIQGTPEIEKYYDISKTINFLSAISLNWNIINNILVVYRNNELVLSKNRVYHTYSSFYDYYIHYNELNVDEWRERTRSDIEKGQKKIYPETGAYLLDEGERSIITYCVPFINNTLSNRGMALFLIDRDELLKMLEIENKFSDSFICIRDQNENLILNHGYDGEVGELLSSEDVNSFKYKGEPYTVFTVSDYDSGLTYIVGTPDLSYQQVLQPVKHLIYLYVLIAAIIGTVLSVMFAIYQYSPVKKLIDIVSSSGINYDKSNNEYDYFKDAFLTVNEDKQKLFEQIQTLDSAIGASMFEKLLVGSYYTVAEKERIQKYYPDIPQRFRLAIVDIRADSNTHNMGKTEKQLLNITFMNSLKKYWTDSILMHPIDENQIVFLIPVEHDNINEKEMASNKLVNIVQTLRNEIKINLFFSISNIYSDLFSMHSAFNEAKNIMRFRHSFNQTVVFVDDLAPGLENYAMSVECVRRLNEYLLIGDIGQASELIYSVFDFEYIDAADFKQLYFSVRGVILGACANLKDDTETVVIPVYDQEKSYSDLVEELVCACRDICNVYENRKKSHNSSLKENIMNFLMDNYANPEVYGIYVANQFGISEKYLYTFFKEQTGMNFAEYLEQLRLKQSLVLLENTRFSISEIAQKVGFNSSNTFYKAFKRVYSISPSNYRSQLEHNKLRHE